MKPDYFIHGADIPALWWHTAFVTSSGCVVRLSLLADHHPLFRLSANTAVGAAELERALCPTVTVPFPKKNWSNSGPGTSSCTVLCLLLR